jgi:acyl-CoA thioester hydrolase
MELISETEITVRFNEADMLQIVWHGHYVNYLEDGRQSFGKKYDLGYMQVYNQGFTIPIVKLNIDFKRPLHFGEKAIVETRFVNSEAAKLIFHYTVRNLESKETIATGETIQVFVADKGELSLTIPDFFAEWKKKWLSNS